MLGWSPQEQIITCFARRCLEINEGSVNNQVKGIQQMMQADSGINTIPFPYINVSTFHVPSLHLSTYLIDLSINLTIYLYIFLSFYQPKLQQQQKTCHILLPKTKKHILFQRLFFYRSSNRSIISDAFSQSFLVAFLAARANWLWTRTWRTKWRNMWIPEITNQKRLPEESTCKHDIESCDFLEQLKRNKTCQKRAVGRISPTTFPGVSGISWTSIFIFCYKKSSSLLARS